MEPQDPASILEELLQIDLMHSDEEEQLRRGRHSGSNIYKATNSLLQT